MRFDAVLFDLDGTLLNTLRDIAESANEALAALGFPTHPWQAYAQYVGEGVQVLFTRALPAAQCTPESLARCAEQFREFYRERWFVHTRPYAGVVELLDTLRTRPLRMAVLSNKPHEFTQRCVDRFLGIERFELVFGQREGVPRKPDPAGACEIADRLQITPQRFLYLGDTGTDMRTACSAAMYPVGALWGFRGRDELVDAGAQTLIAEPQELLELLDSRRV
jgi:phosphoglycolate phosphatase